ncbi:MAG: hypothetical protein ACRC41_07660 [Sarcina sp.]
MGVTIKGRVFDSEIYSTLENSISNVWIVLETPKKIMYKCKTNIKGEYLFSDLVEVGEYNLYEIVHENNNCFENLPQPKGYFYSTSKRNIIKEITRDAIVNSKIFEYNDFTHSSKKLEDIFKDKNIIIEDNRNVFSVDIILGTLHFEGDFSYQNDVILYNKNINQICSIDSEYNLKIYQLGKTKLKVGCLENNNKIKQDEVFHIGLDNNLYILDNYAKTFKCICIDMEKSDYCLNINRKRKIVNKFSENPNLNLFIYNILDGNIYGLDKKNGCIKKLDLCTGEIIILEHFGMIDLKKVNCMFSDELGYIYLIDTLVKKVYIGRISINSISIIKISETTNEEFIIDKFDVSSSNKTLNIISEKRGKISEECINVISGNVVTGSIENFENVYGVFMNKNVENGCINLNETNGIWVYIPNKNFEGIDCFTLRLNTVEETLYKKIVLNVKRDFKDIIICKEEDKEYSRTSKKNVGIFNLNLENTEIDKESIKFLANKVITTKGDIIKFEVFVKNISNLDFQNLKIKNINSVGTHLLNDEVIVNGKITKIAKEINIIEVEQLEAKKDLYIMYSVKVEESNKSYFEFRPFLEYNDMNFTQRSIDFEKIKIQNSICNINIEKKVDKNLVIIGEKIKNTITISNIGTIDIKNLNIKEVLGSSLEYVGNLKINDIISDLSLIDNLKLKKLLVNDRVIITFYTKVIKDEPKINLYTTLGYDYFIADEVFTSDIKSKIIQLKTLKNDITIKKTTSKENLIVGEFFEYYINILNKGEITLSESFIKWDFVRKVEILEIYIGDDIVNLDGEGSLNLPVLYPKEQIRITLFMKANRALNLNSKEYIFLKGKAVSENFTFKKEIELQDITDSSINIYNPSLKLIKSVSEEHTIVKEKVQAKILIINDGDIELRDTIITDILSKELEFIKGSIIVDNLEYKNESIMSGILINSISPGEGVEIKYDFKVIDIESGQRCVKNKATANYLYRINEINRQGNTIYSNECTIYIEKNKLAIVKTWDKDFAVLGEEIEFKIIIQNLGTLDAINVLFVDELLDGFELINRSFSVDGENVNNVNIERGIILGNINIGEVKEIAYKIKILKIKNLLEYNTKTYIKYAYVLENGKSSSLTKYVKNTSEKKLNLAFSNFNIVEKDNILKISDPKPKVKAIDSIKGDIDIYKSYIIDTSKSESIEGKILTGYKLMIYGVLKQSVEYTALTSGDEIYSIVYEIPFYDSIVLPVGFDSSSKIEPYGRIQNNIYKLLSDNRIYTSNTILLLAKILSI